MSAYRRIGTRGAVGLRSRATGVAWPEPVPPGHGVIGLLSRPRAAALFHKLFARSWTCNAGRAGARPGACPYPCRHDDEDDSKFQNPD